MVDYTKLNHLGKIPGISRGRILSSVDQCDRQLTRIFDADFHLKTSQKASELTGE